jgi:hypothetical protein
MVVTEVSQTMFNPAGMRMRRSLVAVIVGVELSVTVSVLAVAAACPTVKLWLAAEDSVAATTGATAISRANTPPFDDVAHEALGVVSAVVACHWAM